MSNCLIALSDHLLLLKALFLEGLNLLLSICQQSLNLAYLVGKFCFCAVEYFLGLQLFLITSRLYGIIKLDLPLFYQIFLVCLSLFLQRLL